METTMSDTAQDRKLSPEDRDVLQWPEACQSMNDMSGWGSVDCDTRDRFFADHRDRLAVFSTLTDPDGHYGRGVIYTEWGVKDGEKPWLRDYRWTGEPCTHYMPAANIAWPTARRALSGTCPLDACKTCIPCTHDRHGDCRQSITCPSTGEEFTCRCPNHAQEAQ
jgi:hypothetical protein